MKSFFSFSLFKSSFLELKQLRTITISGVFIALSIVLRALSIQITTDIRITFSFIGIAVIAMLFGPVVGGMSAFAVDFFRFFV